MVLAGLAFSLAGGCPGRQLILSGEGDSDAATFVLGMIAGAAFAHNFNLAASPDSVVDGIVKVGGISTLGHDRSICRHCHMPGYWFYNERKTREG